MREYDLIADWYSSDRGISVKEALTAVAPLLSGPRVLVDKAFDAAIAWGMLFHPTPRDQATAFASVSRVLKGGAPFLFTAAEIRDVGDNDPGITNDEWRDVPLLCDPRLQHVHRSVRFRAR